MRNVLLNKKKGSQCYKNKHKDTNVKGAWSQPVEHILCIAGFRVEPLANIHELQNSTVVSPPHPLHGKKEK